MDYASDVQIKQYVGYCPACGGQLKFGGVGHYGDMRACQGTCTSCRSKWSFTFDLDKSGTFGVVGLQCDNEDRWL
jgi:hypothetical protein